MKIRKITNFLENIAPLSYQESYDNSGLIVGDAANKVTGVLLCLDAIESVIDEAIELGCNLVVAHHPIVFSGLKKLNGKNYIERTVIKAIKNDIAIYACHTNLDNVLDGVNKKIADTIGLEEIEILAPKKEMLKKIMVSVPTSHADEVRNALFKAGVGALGKYDEASYNTVGASTYRPKENATPYKGEIGKRHYEPEIRIETIFPKYMEGRVINTLLSVHPYEEVAYDIISLDNKNKEVGSGMIGKLKEPMEQLAFLEYLKTVMKTDCIRHTALLNKPIKKVALCGGAGSFLLPYAIGAKADVFITGDYKYHQFFDADNKIIVADIGHYESEQYTIDLFYELLTQKFTTFAVYCTKINTNPVKYF